MNFSQYCNIKIEKLRPNQKQLELIADGIKEVGSGILIAVGILNIIEGKNNIFASLKGLIFALFLWYIAINIINFIKYD